MSIQRNLLFGAIAAVLILSVPAHTQQQQPTQQPPTHPPTNPANRATPDNPNPNNPAQTPTFAPSTAPDSPGIRPDDRKFMKDAAIGGMTEVEMGRLAKDKGSSDGVKQFGQKLIDDHTKANDELRQIAVSKSITMPDSMDARHKAKVDKMSKLSGADFDRAFIKDQVKDHEQDVKEFQQEAQAGTDAEVKNFASKTLPTLQEHLQTAKDLDKGGKTAPSTSADRSKQ